MTVEKQIKHLNTTVKCVLKPSDIHGIGVFALRDIKKGEDLGCVHEEGTWYSVPPERFNELLPYVRRLILDRWPQVEGGRPFKSPNDDQNLMSFMNHSNQPNSQENIALRDIQAGEEITEDYDTGNLCELQKQHYLFINE